MAKEKKHFLDGSKFVWKSDTTGQSVSGVITSINAPVGQTPPYERRVTDALIRRAIECYARHDHNAALEYMNAAVNNEMNGKHEAQRSRDELWAVINASFERVNNN